MILAIDPGNTESGFVLYDGSAVLRSGVLSNRAMLDSLRVSGRDSRRLAIEMVASYGMAVGREVFDTCVWVGRYIQAWHSPDEVRLVYRQQVKLHLCKDSRAKDANIRQALIDKFGPGKDVAIGKKAAPGPLYGVTSHAWAALAVAVTVAEAA